METITSQVIDNFKYYLINEEKSKATIEKYLRDLSAFAAWLGTESADKEKVLEYKQKLIESYAPSSVNSMLSSLNSFFEFAGRHDLVVKTLKIQRRIFVQEEKELTRAEYKRLLAAARKKGCRQLYLLMQTTCTTGIRVSEDI